MISELLKKARTYRRFDRSKLITDADLSGILESVRYTASAGNLQRIRYIIVSSVKAPECFSHIALGGYLPLDKKPDISVAPTAYIVMLAAMDEHDVNLAIDIGIAAEAIVLSAAERGIGACMIRNFDKEYFGSLSSDKKLIPALVIALGYPSENVKIQDVSFGNSLKYYKDEFDINIVPKIVLDDLIVEKYK